MRYGWLFLKVVAFTVLVPGSVAVALPLWIVRDVEPARPALRGAGSLLLGTGAILYAWCAWNFAAHGRGTPAPVDAPRSLVVRGPYRIVRNPMYVGVIAAVLGWAALYASIGLLVYAMGLALAFHLFIVGFEEPALRKAFGAEYEAYRARVGRWLPRAGARP